MYLPGGATERTHPVLVYFHGGFAFGASDLADCKKFIEAGFVVFTPMLRGENGNPGNFEMCLGEVDDARAAIKWASMQPYADKAHIYVFGHSAGGIISTLLSLFDDIDVRLTGSSGGLYGRRFYQTSPIVPFSKSDANEFRFRSLIGNTREMVHEHFAFVGSQDRFQELDAALKGASRSSKLHVQSIPGDHFSSLVGSFERYFEIVSKDLATPRRE